MQLKELVKLSYSNAKEKGFWDKERNVGEMLMLITSELGEALEAHRKNKRADSVIISILEKCDDIFESEIKDTFEDEIADCFIRLADMCGGLNIDIEKFIEAKMAYNKKREKLHGKKY